MRESHRSYLYYVLCAAAGAAALFPVACGYIMDGGMVTEWVARVRELGGGSLRLFPSAEVVVGSGTSGNGMNSNLWFLLPGVIYRATGNMAAAYRVYMTAVQLGTLLASMLFFRRIFKGEDGRLAGLAGVFLYMTCPYRIYICYDYANLSQAAAWMLLPLYLWAVAGLVDGGPKIRAAAASALVLAGVGYADAVFFVALAGMTLAVGLLGRKPWTLAAVAAGGVIFMPGLSRLAGYLFLDGFQELGMPLKSIMPDGYRLGQFFGSYHFREGHPGMGLGMLTAVLAGIWLWFVEGQRTSGARCKVFAGLAGFFALLSLRRFPWDLVERLGMWSVKLVSLADTPAIFWGMAFLCLCVPAAAAVGCMGRHENKLAAYAIPMIVILACAGICVYQCNMLTYSRMPLE